MADTLRFKVKNQNEGMVEKHIKICVKLLQDTSKFSTAIVI